MVRNLTKVVEETKKALEKGEGKVHILNLTKLQAEKLSNYFKEYNVEMGPLHDNYPNFDVATYKLSVGVKNA